MNWSKAKNIFIVAFLFLNSFLGYQLYEKMSNKLEFGQRFENSLDEPFQHKNIKIEADISFEQPQLAQLYAQFSLYTYTKELQKLIGQKVSFNEHTLSSIFETPLEFPTPWNEEAFKEQIIDQNVLRGDEYVLDERYVSEIIFLQKVNKYPIFSGVLSFQIDSYQQIIGYNQIYYEMLNKGTVQPVISSFTCLRTLLDNQLLISNSTIKDVKLGYYGHVYDVESQVLTPTWRVVMDTEEQRQIFYVNAMTGAVESTQKIAIIR